MCTSCIIVPHETPIICLSWAPLFLYKLKQQPFVRREPAVEQIVEQIPKPYLQEIWRFLLRA